jgi:hypothetical protein
LPHPERRWQDYEGYIKGLRTTTYDGVSGFAIQANLRKEEFGRILGMGHHKRCRVHTINIEVKLNSKEREREATPGINRGRKQLVRGHQQNLPGGDWTHQPDDEAVTSRRRKIGDRDDRLGVQRRTRQEE